MRLLLLTMLATAALAQEVSPPDGVHLVGSPAPITFRWGGQGQDYFLEVIAGRAVAFSGPVKGRSITIPLQPGPLYRWKVSEGTAGIYKDPGVYYSFQFQANLTVSLDGANGAPGAPGQVFGAPGGPGGPGQPGQNVNVDLVQFGDFIQVNLNAAGTRRQLWLVPGSTPLQISASGGQGGAGGPGAPGVPGQATPNYQTGYVFTQPGGPGGNGGNGGDGGPGGTVTVRAAAGLNVSALINVLVAGGVGGPGGAPGPGGPAANAYFNNNMQLNVPPVPGPPGQPGTNGRQGRPGVAR